MFALTRHLIDSGHRRIRFIHPSLIVSTAKERLLGFRDAMRTIGIAVDDAYPYCYEGRHFTEEDGVDGCGYLMSLETPPTAIIAGNNDMAPGIYKYLYQHQIRVPEDISVVSYGNIENSELFRIQPTYATLNPYFLGEKAVAHLLSRIERRDPGKREVIFEAQLIVRDSTRAIL